jgi:hypothetical protein
MKLIQLLFSAFLIFCMLTLQGQVKNSNKNVQQNFENEKKPYFIENKGQWPSEVLYLSQMGGLNTWITKKGMQLEFYKTEEIKETNAPDSDPNKFEEKRYKSWGQRVVYNLIGSNPEGNTVGEKKQTAYKNYLIGNDQSKHASNVALYGQVIVKEIYVGIDIRYYFQENLLRYDYIVHPGADASQILFNIEGSDKTYLNNKGELVFTTLFGEVKNTDLYCYQLENKKQVDAKFTNQNGGWSIGLGDYEKSQTLIIDPLIYATYIGGNIHEDSYSVVVDASNNAYVCGVTISSNYDIVTGSFQSTNAGVWDVFVSKLNAGGTALIYSTYVGGSGNDFAVSNAIDTENNIYITGYTDSGQYPVIAGALQTIKGVGVDSFITKLNATGTALIYSTYIGGNNGDYSRSIAVDAANNAYIAGSTNSNNFPTSVGAFQTVLSGLIDVFVSKINASGTALVYSTFVGSIGNEDCQSIAVDSSGRAYITGSGTNGFPITPGAYQSSVGGGPDAFITKLNALGTALVYSTFVGGFGGDLGYDIALDSSENAYITGTTGSINFPLSANAFQTSREGVFGNDGFVTKINQSGTAMIYSTYIGGNGDDNTNSIGVDALGCAYITGYTDSTNFDCTTGAFQTTNAGGRDVFASKFNVTGTALIYSTYIGGSNNDDGYSIALDTSANAYITGSTSSIDFDTTSGAFQTINTGNSRDLFVVKLNMQPQLSVAETIKNNSFSVFPNPSQGIYQILFENKNTTDALIEVYDLQGRLIFNQQVNNYNTIKLDLSNESSGVYLLKVKTSDIQQVLRLVKL